MPVLISVDIEEMTLDNLQKYGELKCPVETIIQKLERTMSDLCKNNNRPTHVNMKWNPEKDEYKYFQLSNCFNWIEKIVIPGQTISDLNLLPFNVKGKFLSCNTRMC